MIPVTILTGFLGSGKTTICLKLLPQLPKDYKIALLKNEFGDLAVDSQLASEAAIGGVQELLNGCICCNLVGQLGDALETLRQNVKPDRIIIETSGSAFPATLAMEINRLGDETGYYVLDGVVSVVDVENWKGYEDTSYTAKMQAKYTDLIVFNKWELVDERRYDECLDRVGDLDIQIATVKSDKGYVPQELLLGIDSSLAKTFPVDYEHGNEAHDHAKDHESEVEVLSVTLASDPLAAADVDTAAFEGFLSSAPKDEIYRIKGLVVLASTPAVGHGIEPKEHPSGAVIRYILNWAFGRWNLTRTTDSSSSSQLSSEKADATTDAAMRLTVVTARYESEKWRKRLSSGAFVGLSSETATQRLHVRKLT